MAMGDITITPVGNLADAPETRFLEDGTAVTKFRLAVTPRFFDKAANEWKDGDPSWVAVTAWRRLAENIATSDFKKGDRLIVTGTFRERSYEAEGTKRYVWECTADAVGPELTYATAVVTRNPKGGGSNAARGDETWANASKTAPTTAAGPSADTQRTTQAAAPAATGADEEPPW
jgi:single-strand DNA-binding protein